MTVKHIGLFLLVGLRFSSSLIAGESARTFERACLAPFAATVSIPGFELHRVSLDISYNIFNEAYLSTFPLQGRSFRRVLAWGVGVHEPVWSSTAVKFEKIGDAYRLNVPKSSCWYFALGARSAALGVSLKFNGIHTATGAESAFNVALLQNERDRAVLTAFKFGMASSSDLATEFAKLLESAQIRFEPDDELAITYSISPSGDCSRIIYLGVSR